MQLRESDGSSRSGTAWPTRLWGLASGLGMAVAFVAPPATAQETLTVDQAVTQALASNPEIEAANARVSAARGRVTEAGRHQYNPEIVAAAGPAEVSDTTFTNVQLGLTQTLEIGGKRGARRGGAEARLSAEEWRLVRLRQLVRWEATTAFYQVVLERERVSATREAETLAGQVASAAARRLDRGAGTLLEANFATAEIPQARKTRLEAERRLESARLNLVRVVGMDQTAAVAPIGAIPPIQDVAEEHVLLARAAEARGDLRAAESESRAADAAIRLARATVWPDPTLWISASREEVVNKAWFGVTIPVPLWNRNQGTREAARAELLDAQASERGLRRRINQEVLDAYQAWLKAVEAERAFGDDAVTRLTENLTLANASLENGKISLLDHSLIRRSLVEAQLDYLDAVGERVQRHALLELAVGDTITPQEGGMEQ